MSATTEMPVGVLEAFEMLRVTLARGCPEGGPYWRQPKGGRIKIDWMQSLGAYRFTVDLIPPLPFPEEG